MRKWRRFLKWFAFWWCLASAASLVGCVTLGPSGESYPEYNCWWR